MAKQSTRGSDQQRLDEPDLPFQRYLRQALVRRGHAALRLSRTTLEFGCRGHTFHDEEAQEVGCDVIGHGAKLDPMAPEYAGPGQIYNFIWNMPNRPS